MKLVRKKERPFCDLLVLIIHPHCVIGHLRNVNALQGLSSCLCIHGLVRQALWGVWLILNAKMD